MHTRSTPLWSSSVAAERRSVWTLTSGHGSQARLPEGWDDSGLDCQQARCRDDAIAVDRLLTRSAPEVCAASVEQARRVALQRRATRGDPEVPGMTSPTA